MSIGPLAVSLVDKQVLIMPSQGNNQISPNDMDLGKEGEPDPNCSDFDSNGVAVCRRFQPLGMFVGGAMDAKYRPMLDAFSLYDSLNGPYQDIGYATWDAETQLKSIALHWLANRQRVVLVGHSFGGATSLKAAQVLSEMGKEVELLVTLDPVWKSGPWVKPRGVKKWLNTYVDYEKADGGAASPNGIARIGGPWGACAGADVNRVFPVLSADAHARAWDMFAFFRSDVEAVR